MMTEQRLCDCGCGERLEGRQQRWRPGHRDKARAQNCLCGQPKSPRRGARYCEDCRIEMRAEALERAREANRIRETSKRRKRGAVERVDVASLTHRTCRRCKVTKPVAEMHPVKGKPSTTCEDCYPEQMHEYRLQRVFGITAGDYYTMLAEQDGVCAICQKRPRKRRLAVDHDHSTGEIRGLLCTRCNHKVLGAADENPQILRRAADYLDAPPAVNKGHIVPELTYGDVNRWLRQAQEEAGDRLPVVVAKPRGQTDVGKWWALLTFDDLLGLLEDR